MLINIYMNDLDYYDHKFDLKIINLKSDIVFQQFFFGNKTCVNVSNLNSGIYFYLIEENGKKMQEGKFVISR